MRDDASVFAAGLCATALVIALPLIAVLYVPALQGSPTGALVASLLDALFDAGSFVADGGASGLALAARKVASRVIVASLMVCAIGLAIVRRKALRETIRRFFAAEDHAFNLAVFRIVFFWSVTYGVSLDRLVHFSRMSPLLLDPPYGMATILSILPVNETWVTGAWYLFQATRFFALVGLFTRTSAFLTGAIGAYVLGVASFYGKVDHNGHHILWFAWILAASPCGDALSLDTFLTRLRARDWRRPRPSPDRAYAAPLRMLWLSMGFLYLFPGFWKLWEGGLDWISSSNLTYTMYGRWWLDQSVPWLRPDRYPALMTAGAACAVIFEIGFLFAIFFPGPRLAFAAAGVLFHQVTSVMLRITFTRLSLCYVAFVDWWGIGSRVAGRLARTSLARRWASRRPGIVAAARRWRESAAKDSLARPSAVFVHRRLATWVGVALLGVHGFHGLALRQYAAWPFGIFPTFEEVARRPAIETMEIAALDGQGNPLAIAGAVAELEKALGRERWLHNSHRVLDDPSIEGRKKALRPLWEQLVSLHPELGGTASVHAYKVLISTTPGSWTAPALEKRAWLSSTPHELVATEPEAARRSQR